MNGHRRGKSGIWKSQVKLSGKRTLCLIPSGKSRGPATSTEGANTTNYWCESLRFATEAYATNACAFFNYLNQSKILYILGVNNEYSNRYKIYRTGRMGKGRR